jgi:hypothetical protein
MNPLIKKASCNLTEIFFGLIVFLMVVPSSAVAQPSQPTSSSTSSTGVSDGGNIYCPASVIWGYGLRNPSGKLFLETQFGGLDVTQPVPGGNALQSVGAQSSGLGGLVGSATGLSGATITYGSGQPTKATGPIQAWPMPVLVATSQVPTMRDTAILKNLLPTWGYPVSDTQFQMISRFNDNIMIEELSNPERMMWLVATMGQQMATGTGDSAAQAASNQTQNAIEFSRRYLINFTTDGSNEWNTIRNQLFIPIAILLLLPGAVLAQVRAIVAQGYSSVLGEINPFEGIMRSVVAIFLIPGTYLVVNYGIDVSNSLALTVANGYTNIFGTDMYEDAKCLQRRAAAVNAPYQNDNGIVASETTPQGSTDWPDYYEAETHITRKFDPCAGIDQVLVPNERMSSARATNRMILNLMNATMGTGWLIMCAFQVVFLLYLFVMGPIVAALWVWPITPLRQALPSWIEGVLMLCFWSLFWSTVILLMACFRGFGDDGVAIGSALNALANLAVVSGFNFTGLVQQAAGYLQQAVSVAGGSGGGAAGAQSGSGVGQASNAAQGTSNAGRAGAGRSTAGKTPGSPGAATAGTHPGAAAAAPAGAGTGPQASATPGGSNTSASSATTTSSRMPVSVATRGGASPAAKDQVPPGGPPPVTSAGAHPGDTPGAGALPIGQGSVNPEALYSAQQQAQHHSVSASDIASHTTSLQDKSSTLGQYLSGHPDQVASAAAYLAMSPNVSEAQLGNALNALHGQGTPSPTVGDIDRQIREQDPLRNQIVHDPALQSLAMGGTTGSMASYFDANHPYIPQTPPISQPPGGPLEYASMPGGQFTQVATNPGAIDGLNLPGGITMKDQSGADVTSHFDSNGHLLGNLPKDEQITAFDKSSGHPIATYDMDKAQWQGVNPQGINVPGVTLAENGHWHKDGVQDPLVYDRNAQAFEVAGANGTPSGIAVASDGQLHLAGSDAPVRADSANAGHGHYYADLNGRTMAYDGSITQGWSTQGSNGQFSWDATSHQMILNGSEGQVHLDTSASGGPPHLAMAGTNTPVSMDNAGTLSTTVGGQQFTREANAEHWTTSSMPAGLNQYNWDGKTGHMTLEGYPNVYLDQSKLATDVGGQQFTYDQSSNAWSAASAPGQYIYDQQHHQMDLVGSNGSVYLNTSVPGHPALEMVGTNAPVSFDNGQVNYVAHDAGNQHFTLNQESGTWSSASLPNQTFQWNGEQMVASSHGAVYHDQFTSRTELAAAQIPIIHEGSSHLYRAEIAGNTFVDSYGTHTPVTYESGTYYATDSNHHVYYDTSSQQLYTTASSEHHHGHIPVIPVNDGSGNYIVANSGGQLTYNPNSDYITVTGTNVPVTQSSDGSTYVAAVQYGDQPVYLRTDPHHVQPGEAPQFFAGNTPVHMTEQGWVPNTQMMQANYTTEYPQAGLPHDLPPEFINRGLNSVVIGMGPGKHSNSTQVHRTLEAGESHVTSEHHKSTGESLNDQLIRTHTNIGGRRDRAIVRDEYIRAFLSANGRLPTEEELRHAGLG